MFDNMKNMAGLAGMLKDLPRIKEQMEAVKERLGQKTVQSETGGGAVKATVNGLLQVQAIDVDDALLRGLIDTDNPDDRQLAQELMVGAVNAGLQKAREMAEQEVAAVAADLGLPIPPDALGKMLS